MNSTRGVFSNLFGARDSSTCEVCGNHYDKCLKIRIDGKLHVFDCFECAIHALAPACAHCGCRIIGHGMEANGNFFCCAYCATQFGVEGFQDRMKLGLNDEERRTE